LVKQNKKIKMPHGSKPSLTQKYLAPDCWALFQKQTSFGTTIYDCCKSALENPDSNVGLYAPGTRKNPH
jgi:creatine kinase